MDQLKLQSSRRQCPSEQGDGRDTKIAGRGITCARRRGSGRAGSPRASGWGAEGGVRRLSRRSRRVRCGDSGCRVRRGRRLQLDRSRIARTALAAGTAVFNTSGAVLSDTAKTEGAAAVGAVRTSNAAKLGTTIGGLVGVIRHNRSGTRVAASGRGRDLRNSGNGHRRESNRREEKTHFQIRNRRGM